MSVTGAQERDWINRAQGGSVAAFEQLVRHYQERLLRYLMLRGLLQADAEDAAQTAFVRAWQNLPGYRSKWRFSTWLYAIARHCAIERQSKPMGRHMDTHNSDIDAVSTGLDTALAAQLRDNLWAVARNQLEPPAFQALWLHYGEGFTGKEIARIMERSSVWVRVTLHRARTQLRQVFATDNTTMVEQHEH